MTKTHRNPAAAADESFHRHYAAIWSEDRWKQRLFPALTHSTRYACLQNRYINLTHARQAVDGFTLRTSLEDLKLPMFHRQRQEIQGVPGEELTQNYSFATKQSADEEETTSHTTGSQFFPPPFQCSRPDGTVLLSHWNLDGASLLVADLVNVQPGDTVLDLCAAPGGKSLALSQMLWPYLHVNDSLYRQRNRDVQSGILHSNEDDPTRHRRLAENMKSYLPAPLFSSIKDDRGRFYKRADILRIDASKPSAADEFPFSATIPSRGGYDKVLVDAPCSSERHIIHAQVKARASGKTAPELANWKPGSSKRLAKTQTDLLMTGIRCAKVGGTIVYATCSIEPTENDGVVEKMLAQVDKERKKGAAKFSIKIGFKGGAGDDELEKEIESQWAEKTKYGWMVLPDHPKGGSWGPLFFTILTKIGD